MTAETSGNSEPQLVDRKMVARQLAINYELTEKVASYKERTPVAPRLAELTQKLERLVFMSEAAEPDAQELSETYSEWLAQLEEAKAYYDR